MRDIKFRIWTGNKFKTIPQEFVGDRCAHRCMSTEQDKFCSFILKSHENSVYQLYTGFKDWNNKEIYEGDIIDLSYSRGHERDSSYDYYGEYKVEFKNGEWKLIKIKVYSWEKDDFYNERTLWLESVRTEKEGMQNFKIIGNIFENPELLND